MATISHVSRGTYSERAYIALWGAIAALHIYSSAIILGRMSMQLSFRKLNEGWNAEPNAPEPSVAVSGHDVVLRFSLNPFQFTCFAGHDEGALRFVNCSQYRLGATNDEGWYRGQCRYSGLAPEWGEFYEITGPDPHLMDPTDWKVASGVANPSRHFLFYFRDETFECLAADWTFERVPENALIQRLRSGRG